MRGLPGLIRGHNASSPWYQASPKGSWKQVKSPRMRIIHSNAVEVERGVAHSTSIFDIVFELLQ